MLVDVLGTRALNLKTDQDPAGYDDSTPIVGRLRRFLFDYTRIMTGCPRRRGVREGGVRAGTRLDNPGPERYTKAENRRSRT